ncbi:hypothetical protein [Paenirhodobacter populi]|uniref:Growth inhibitor PemK n=1 Tax=Paenirhodobacter populi TaxID=2306993 RepID=A0A443JRH1_9RHOB|nr:hypothetical protein [Sinirhodobacter populi]RWR23089.1 hypothetical protein D2T30_05565 [Sinirhodobacter populi]
MTDSQQPDLGDVWVYPFLWSREAARGETEGRKERPVSLLLLSRNAKGEVETLLAPITSQPSEGNAFAVEVPEIEKRRAGLDQTIRLWVIADEVNTDIPAKSYYFEPGNRIGGFSKPFVKKVQAVLIEAVRARKLRQTPRR